MAATGSPVIGSRPAFSKLATFAWGLFACVVAMQAESTVALFMRTCFNYPTLGDLYKYATYAAMLKRDGLVVDDSGQLPTRTVS